MTKYEVHVIESAELHGGDPGELRHVIWGPEEFDYWQDTAAGVSFWRYGEPEYTLISRTPQRHIHKVWAVPAYPVATPEPTRYESAYDHLQAPLVNDNSLVIPTHPHTGESLSGEWDPTRFEHAKFIRNNDPDELMVTRADEDSGEHELTPIEHAMRVPGEPVEEIREYVRSLVARQSPLAPYSDIRLVPSGGAASEIVQPLKGYVTPDENGLPKREDRRDTRGEQTTFFFPVIIPESHKERIPSEEGTDEN